MFTTRPEIIGNFGAVTSTHWIASAVGMRILERGGNAFDAAVATGLALQVAEPHMNGPGGDLPILFLNAKEGRVRTICGQGVAPRAATISHYKNLGFDLIPGMGLLATVVPGAFDAWMLLLRDHGTLDPSEIFAPAIAYAEHGVPLTLQVIDTIAGVQELFLKDWPTSAATWLPNSQPPQPNKLYTNPTLAATWRRLLDAGKTGVGHNREDRIDAIRYAWAQGFVAEAIDRFCRATAVRDSSGEQQKAVLTGEDLAQWHATYEDPLLYDYDRFTIAKCGPWSQGPVMLQALALLKNYDIAAMDPIGSDFVHIVTETMKLAFADREAYYGDPNFISVPIDQLLSNPYNKERTQLITAVASQDLRPGLLPNISARLPRIREVDAKTGASLASLGIGEPTAALRRSIGGDTCHLDVIDRWGNMVSATPSGGWLQSSPTIPELGFCLNSRAQMFWLEDGLPSSLAPGKRPRTTLSPSFALRDGMPYLAFGTPGGDQQDQWQLIFFLRHAHYQMNLQEAIDAPSFHSEHFPSSFFPRQAAPNRLIVEDRFSIDVLKTLERKGHIVVTGGSWVEGRLTAASLSEGLIKAAANPRGMQGYAIGR